MAQWVRAYTALVEEPSSTPSMHIRQLVTPVTRAPGTISPLSPAPGTSSNTCAHGHISTIRHKRTHGKRFTCKPRRSIPQKSKLTLDVIYSLIPGSMIHHGRPQANSYSSSKSKHSAFHSGSWRSDKAGTPAVRSWASLKRAHCSV